MAGTARVSRQIVEVLTPSATIYAPYTYGTTYVTRQMVDVLVSVPFFDLIAYNTLVISQVSGETVAAAMAEYIKPLVSESNTIHTMQSTDTINHGDFPVWSTNDLEWTQTRQAINIRVEENAACFNHITTTFGSLSSTWLGGILAPSGNIYGIPDNSGSNAVVLKIDPTTDTVTTFVGQTETATFYYKEITISHTNVSGDLSNFPLCVKITGDTDIGAVCMLTGDDIYFKDSGGNVLYTECDSFTVTGGAATGVFWVKVPTISSTADTTIYCHYGDGSSGSRTGTTSVWDSNFVGVWHFGNGTTLSTSDSTINANNGTNAGAVTAAAGMLGGGASFPQSSTGIISVPNSSTLNMSTSPFQVEFWMAGSDQTNCYSSAIGTYNNAGYSSGAFGLRWDDSCASVVKRVSLTHYNVGDRVIYNTADLTFGTWYHVVLTRSGTTLNMYINGTLNNTATISSSLSFNWTNNSSPMYIGGSWDSNGQGGYKGLLDEVRISNTARSAAWIKFSYYNQYSGELTWGSSTPYAGSAQLRYSGGVLAPNGSIYCIPSTNVSVLKIDPTTDGTTLFGNFSGSSKWAGGAMFTTGMIYGIPNNSTTVLQIDPTTDIATIFGSLTGTTKWQGGVLASNGSIYGIPNTSTSVLKISQSEIADYSYYKQITISHSLVSSDLTNFPLCVQFNGDTDVGAACLSSGNDIRFIDINGGVLYAEKDSFTITGGAATGVFWVNIPTISSTADTIIYMFYGNASATAQLSQTSVWDSNFVGVWHFGDGTTLSTSDSTINNDTGSYSGIAASSGKVGGSAIGTGSGSSWGYIETANATPVNMTVSCWIYLSGTSGTYNIFGASTNGILLKLDSNGKLMLDKHNVVEIANYTGVSLASWQHIAISITSGSSYALYVNGASVKSGSTASSLTSQIARIGSSIDAGTNWAGSLDEFRLSNIVRSAAWIAFEYANQTTVNGQLTVGAQIANDNTAFPFAIRTFGSLSGTTKWHGGVLASNGMIYGIPYSSTSILKIDPTTDTATTFGTVSGSWHGGVLASNGMIYGIPYNSTTVLKIDPITDTATTFGSLTGSTKWAGGVLATNGIIYGIPKSSTTILKIGTILDDVPQDFCLSRYFNKY
ncbi:MAG: DUF2341 domain-containing protein [Candidatus Cloacimonetes bacterium]|jgi:hypothetical protein|nr:DUF2341 domain-containing protein [Candidatus Cloacimonadota bacterium]